MTVLEEIKLVKFLQESTNDLFVKDMYQKIAIRLSEKVKDFPIAIPMELEFLEKHSLVKAIISYRNRTGLPLKAIKRYFDSLNE